MKIVSYAIPAGLSDFLAARLGDCFCAFPYYLSDESFDPETGIAVINVASAVDRKTLEKMPALKAVVSLSVGLEHIDIEGCRARGVEVRSCPAYAANAVAELALGLALTGIRDLGAMAEAGKGPLCTLGIGMGSELRGKTCAVLGTGHIGSGIARLLLAFGCKVKAYSRSEKKNLSSAGASYGSLSEALKADIIFVSLPHTRETHHLIGEKELSMMADRTAIVNVSRGEIIDSEALLKHMSRLSFVATDVLEGQYEFCRGKDFSAQVRKLIKKPNFIRTPYIGVCTKEAGIRLGQEALAILSELKAKYGP